MRDRLWDKGKLNMHGEVNEMIDRDEKKKTGDNRISTCNVKRNTVKGCS
jgi:hypothetical protein